jgi:hypothetical protein
MVSSVTYFQEQAEVFICNKADILLRTCLKYYILMNQLPAIMYILLLMKGLRNPM